MTAVGNHMAPLLSKFDKYMSEDNWQGHYLSGFLHDRVSEEWVCLIKS